MNFFYNPIGVEKIEYIDGDIHLVFPIEKNKGNEFKPSITNQVVHGEKTIYARNFIMYDGAILTIFKK